MAQAVARIGVLTVSDRASRGEYEDRGGPAIRDYLRRVLSSPWEDVSGGGAVAFGQIPGCRKEWVKS